MRRCSVGVVIKSCWADGDVVFGNCGDGFCTEEVVWLESGIGVVLFTMMVVIVLGCAVSLCRGERVVVMMMIILGC